MTVAAGSSKLVETADLAPFKKLLMRTFGHSFENEREQALSDGLCRRMAARSINEADAYLAVLLHDSDELLRLTELLTVNETYFFREPDHLNLMVDKLLPELMSSRKQGPVRILSAGCSTGEEPYTIAIMLRERFGSESERLFAITGVDIDSTVIATARQGVYGKGSFRGMDPVVLDRYFEPRDLGRFQVSDTIRQQVGFEIVNLLGASYPPSMQTPDIILYRNVSIYFPGQVQREIFGRLSELLADGGCLLVGASETIHHDIGILSLVKQDALFFYRKIPAIVFEERRTPGYDTTIPRRSLAGAAPAAAISAARAGIRQNREQQAPVYERTRKQTQPDVKERFDAAIALAHNKQHDQALAILDAIIGQDSTFEKAYCLKGSLLLSISRFDEAHTVCNGILSRDPLCREAYLMLGMIARQRGDDDDAVKRFREALYLDGSCWLAHFFTAEIRYAQGDEKRARSGYEAAVRILEKGSILEHGRAFFPLSFNAEQFSVICRHKLSLLTPTEGGRGPAKASPSKRSGATLLKKNG
ncbi:MAG: tetratricopeptide repeat protein [Geobacteraceae bacterium]|nr:tetratricopeptide repeat protein [Geobacteraceae bacterium]